MKYIGLFLLMMLEFFLSLMMGLNAWQAITTNSPWLFLFAIVLSWFNWKSAALKFVWFREAAWAIKKRN